MNRLTPPRRLRTESRIIPDDAEEDSAGFSPPKKQTSNLSDPERHFVPAVRLPAIAAINEFINRSRRGRRPARALAGRILLGVGTTGTGKTSTIRYLLGHHQDRGYRVLEFMAKTELQTADLIVQNMAVKFTAAQQMSTRAQRDTLRHLHKRTYLEDKFEYLGRIMDGGKRTILFLDEIDMAEAARDAATKDSCLDVFLHFCQTNLPAVLIVGATNDSKFPALVAKRYGIEPTVVEFDNYGYEQMVDIIRKVNPRINVDDPGMQYGIRRIAAQRGDFRQILDLIFRNQPSRLPADPEASTSAASDFNVDVRTSTSLVSGAAFGALLGEESIEYMQETLGRNYKAAVPKVVDTVRTLPHLHQMICAIIMIYIDRRGLHQNLSAPALYVAYKDHCDMIAADDTVTRAQFDNCLTALEVEDLLKVEKPPKSRPTTPLMSHRTPNGRSVSARGRSKTPVSKSRPPQGAGPTADLSIDFCLDAKTTRIAFRKLKDLKLPGYRTFQLLDS